MIKYREFSLYGVAGLPRFGEQNSIISKLSVLEPYNKSISIYIHIPFCQQNCNFCKLRFGGRISSKIPQKYINALVSEINSNSALYLNNEIDSIHFGGGTPSLLDKEQFLKILSAIKMNFRVSENYSISMEGDADSFLSKDIITSLDEFPITSISLGVQTFNMPLRKLLNRKDSLKNYFVLNEKISKYTGLNLNIDYLYNLPIVSECVIENDLNCIKDLYPTSIDLHPLKYSSCKSSFLQSIVNDNLKLPNAEKRIEEFNCLRRCLIDMGYKELLMGFLSRKNEAHRYLLRLHNLLGGEYIGFGLGARSYYCDHAFSNTFNLNEYYNQLSLSKDKPISRMVYAPLVDNYITLFPKRGGRLFFPEIEKSLSREYFYSILDELSEGGYLIKGSNFYEITPDGCNWYQNLMENLLSPSQKLLHIESLNRRIKVLDVFQNQFGGLSSEYVES